IFVYCDSLMQTTEQLITRGYQSGVSPVLHIGLGKVKKIDSLRVIWPSGKITLLKDVAINSVLQLNETNSDQIFHFIPKQNKTLLHSLNNVVNYTHVENATN